MIDTHYLVETPEGIDIQADLAGVSPRALAYSLDLLIRTIVIILFSIAVSFLSEFGVGLILIFSFVLEWFYPVYFEVMHRGQTPGKKRLNLAVVNADLTPVRWEASIIRNLLRTVDLMPFFYQFGVLSICLSSRCQRLGDIAADTLVVHRLLAGVGQSLPQAEPVAPPAGLNQADQLAIIAFARRHKILGHERQKELASVLEPVTGKQGDLAVEHLRGIGNWLAGARGTETEHSE